MSKIVYCDECEWYVGRTLSTTKRYLESCEAPMNKTEGPSHLSGSMTDSNDKPANLNKNNDCKWYEKYE